MKSGITPDDVIHHGDMMERKISSGHMVLSVAMGFAVIVNLVATSRYEFYPIEFVTGAAFAVGIAMVAGTLVFLMGEPKPIGSRNSVNFPFPAPSTSVVKESRNAFHTASRVRVAASA
jgi:hypothetical protein